MNELTLLLLLQDQDCHLSTINQDLLFATYMVWSCLWKDFFSLDFLSLVTRATMQRVQPLQTIDIYGIKSTRILLSFQFISY